MITEEDKDKIRQLIMSDDIGNVTIGVKIAKNVLGMKIRHLKDLITMNDCTSYRNGNLTHWKLSVFGAVYKGSDKYSAWNLFRQNSTIRISKLYYDLD